MYVGIGIRHTQQIMCPVAGSFGPIGLFPFSGFLPFLHVQLDQIENFNFLDFYLSEIQVVLPGPPVQCNKWSCEPISGQCSHCQACLLSSLPALPHHTTQCTPHHTMSVYLTPRGVPHTTHIVMTSGCLSSPPHTNTQLY